MIDKDSQILLKENIQNQIFMIRGAQVIIDRDLAEFYHVETRVLNQAVKRNHRLFPITKKNRAVKVTILSKTITRQHLLDVKKFNEQYPSIEIKEFTNSHDRFLIIDNSTVYHFGASLKDLGKKWFAFSKMDTEAVRMIARLNLGEENSGNLF